MGRGAGRVFIVLWNSGFSAILVKLRSKFVPVIFGENWDKLVLFRRRRGAYIAATQKTLVFFPKYGEVI